MSFFKIENRHEVRLTSDTIAANRGATRHKGWSFMIKDEWRILDAQDNLVGSIKEDTMVKVCAVLSRSSSR